MAKFATSLWLLFTLFVIGFIVFDSIQLYKITRIFRRQDGVTGSELQMGFGQLIVLFMILQLLAESGLALSGESTVFF
jgi:hypothetical protein